MAAIVQIEMPEGSPAALQQETVMLLRLLAGQPDVDVERAPDGPIAPGEKGAVLGLGALIVSVLKPEAVRGVIDGLKAYLGRGRSIKVSITGENGAKIEVDATNLSPDQIVETASRLRAVLAPP